jgi:hypothetical protein
MFKSKLNNWKLKEEEKKKEIVSCTLDRKSHDVSEFYEFIKIVCFAKYIYALSWKQ